MRDRSIDVGRGLLVLMMVYGHVLQFFGDTQLFPVESLMMDGINLTVFPTFVFYFGATAVLAYLRKPYRQALPGMMKTGFRALAAFWLSGIGYRVLRENKPFAAGTVRKVLQLNDIPGWSEFLIAFALYSLLLIVGFRVFDMLSGKPAVALTAGLACLACCLIPYGSVAPTQLALLIGGTQFSYFPVVQYMPYFLAGLVYARGETAQRRLLLLTAAAASTAGVVCVAVRGGLPSRFPPHWGWIMLPALCTAAVVCLSRGLCALENTRAGRAARAVSDVLSHFGSRSLYYLLGSNLVLFTMAGKGIVPAVSRKSVIPWTTPIQSPKGAIIWTGLMLGALAFVALLAGRGGKHADRKK